MNAPTIVDVVFSAALNKWTVTVAGEKPLGPYNKQTIAIAWAREVAKAHQPAVVILHDRDGGERWRRHYPSLSQRPRGIYEDAQPA